MRWKREQSTSFEACWKCLTNLWEIWINSNHSDSLESSHSSQKQLVNYSKRFFEKWFTLIWHCLQLWPSWLRADCLFLKNRGRLTSESLNKLSFITTTMFQDLILIYLNQCQSDLSRVEKFELVTDITMNERFDFLGCSQDRLNVDTVLTTQKCH